MKNKRFLSLVLSIVLVTSLFTGFVSNASAENDVLSYSVRNGDYLFKICKAYGLDYYQCKNAIMILNGFTSEIQLNRLTVGQVVRLPASNAIAQTVKGSQSTTTTTTTSTTVNGVTTTTTSSSTISGAASNYAVSFYLIPHVVQSGETLATICNAYGTTYAQYASMILSMNNISSPNNVWAGKTIYVPSTKTPAAGGFYAVVAHTVQKGETMTNICSGYGTSYAANATLINGLNNKSNLNTIYAGQTLYVPVVATAGTVAGIGGGTGSSGGSGTSAQSGYKINLLYHSAEGAPYATVDGNKVTRAESGVKVKIKGAAKSGYALKDIVVKRADNDADVVVKSGSFTMPPCDVNVTLNYSKGYEITRNVKGLNNGTFETIVNDEAVEYACYGDLVTLNFSSKAGYTPQFVYVIYDGGFSEQLTRDKDGSYSFKMQNCPCMVDVTFEKAALLPIHTVGKAYDVTITDYNDYKDPVYDVDCKNTYKVDGVQNTAAAKNTQVTFTVSPKSGYKVKEVRVYKHGTSYVDANKIALTKSDDTYKFKMPDFANGVDVLVILRKTYSITAKSVTGGSITFSNSDDANKKITSAYEGETVYIVVKPNSGYKLDSIKVTYAGGASSAPVAAPLNPPYHHSFEMPANNVTVTPKWVKDASMVKYNIKTNSPEHGSLIVKVSDSFGVFNKTTKACSGDMVRIYINPDKKYELDTISFDGGFNSPPTIGYDENNMMYYEDVMPSNDLKVTAKFKLSSDEIKIIPSYADDENGNRIDGVKINALVNGYVTDNARVGYTITADFTIPDGYVLAKGGPDNKPMVFVDRYDGASFHSYYQVTANSDGKYCYKIKELDITDYGFISFGIVLKPVKSAFKILASSGNYGVYDIYGNPITESEPAKTVYIELYSGYCAPSLRVFTGNAGNPTNVSVKTEQHRQKFSFVMPNADVTTEPDEKLIAQVTTSLTGVEMSCSEDLPYMGETVNYTFTPSASGTLIDKVEIDGVNYLPYPYDGEEFSIAYTIPDYAFTIEANAS